jgi:Transglutaminase-like superfamily
MKKICRIAELPLSELRLLIGAAIVLGLMRLGLWLLSLRRLRALLRRDKLQLCRAGSASPDRIGWAVQVASRYVPKATCLAQALTAKMLLESAGFPANLHIGVARGEQERFEAHAWVETDGRVISGGSELERYSPLLLWEK